MQVVRMKFTLRPERLTRLPEYKGPMLRGALGYALLRMSCPFPEPRCEGCHQFDRCMYVLLYKSEQLHDRSAPNPIIISPPPLGASILSQQDTLEFAITLVGEAVHGAPVIIASVINAAQSGLGRDMRRFRVESIERFSWTSRSLFYDASLGYLEDEVAPFTLSKVDGFPRNSVRQLTIEFLSPVAMRDDHRRPIDHEDGLPFHRLIRQVIGRLSTLYHLYDGGAPTWDYAGMIEDARSIRTGKLSSLKPFPVRRGPNPRRRQSQRYPAAIGIMEYYGRDLSRYIPYLMMGELTHVGQRTTFGLGHYRTLWSQSG